MKNAVKAGIVGLSALTMSFSGAATAEDNAALTSSSSITHKQELALLGQASEDSSAHAESGFNIGLILHIGDDIPQEHLQTVVDHFANRYQTALDSKYPNRGSAEVFTSPNPGTRSSGITINIGNDIFQVDNAKYGLPEDLDPALLDQQTADRAAEDVVALLPIAKALQAQRGADLRQTASLEGYTPIGLN